MARLKEKIYRDPVHDLVVLNLRSREDRTLVNLIDAAEFQRLRRVRQLGLANVAFQGAEHTRFVHSIGVMWIVTRILDRLQRVYGLDSDLLFPARCAALLHDIGHGPMSHVSEGLFGQDHEAWTREIVCSSDSEVNHVLCGYDLALPSMVVAILDHASDPPFLSDLISSQLDADRLDYLIRDSLMTGVKHGVYDLERLIVTLRLDEGRRRLVVGAKGVAPVEKYLESRYHMFRQVYQHKTVKAAEGMFEALVRRAFELTGKGRRLSAPEDSAMGRFLEREGRVGLKDYLALDDVVFRYHLSLWAQDVDGVLSDLSRRLMGRDLFKSVPVDVDAPGFGGRLEEARDLLASQGFDPTYYLLRLESSDTPFLPLQASDALGKGAILYEPPEGEAEVGDFLAISHVARALAEGSYRQTRMAFPAGRGATDLRGQLSRILMG